MQKIRSIYFKLFYTAALLIGVASTSFSQEFKFTHITAEQGLSMGVVNCVFQDSRGFMWFGTQDGLNKYDGYNITVFKHNPVDSNSLSNNFINVLYENKKTGDLLIGTNGGGFDSYNLSTGKFKHHIGVQGNNNSLSNNNVKAILEDTDGLLWMGTDDGLNSYDPKTNKFTRYLNSDSDVHSISNNNAWCLHQGGDGKIWIGTYGGGLNSFDKKTGKFEHYNQFSNSGSLLYEGINLIRTIYEDKEGILWIGTYGEGIQVFDPQFGHFLKNIRHNPSDPNSLNNDQIMSITEDNNGLLWIATYGAGINLYNKKTGRFRSIISDEKNIAGLNNNQIKCIYHDRVGSVWIGTEGGGVNAHFRSSNKFKFYTNNSNATNGLQSNIVYALLEDRDGLLWIGTGHGGLATLDRETNTYKQYEFSIGSNNSILSLFEDKEGLIWVGTWGGGLNSYDKKTKKIISYPQFKTSQTGTITCIYQDEKGLIWVGTYKAGIFVIDKTSKEVKNYTTDTGLSSDNIYSIYEDSKGYMWIATDGGGVMKFNPAANFIKIYARDEKNNSISSNSANCIYEDKKGNLWFGTANGLNMLNIQTEHFDHYFEKDGLPNDFIYCIMPDGKGNLWMSTNKGVSKFNPEKKNENGAAFRNYDVNDGLQGLEFNQGAYYLSKKGEMFLGGVNGFNTFFPDKINDNPSVPPVQIISYKRFGKEVEMDTLIYDKKYIELSYRQNFFSFDFAALDYQMPTKNKYSYMLEGVDDDWSPPSTQHYASYTELSGGDYVLRVRGANNDGTWNNEGATLHIRINPPFWKTKWFYSLSVFLIIAGFWGFLKYRTSAIKRENKILEEKVEERTQELAQKNKDITSSIQYAKRIQLAILPPLEQVFKFFPSSFILYKPKDIVSGDFYWFGVKDGKKIIAAVDCTGHGVPGAFMSMIGHNLLNQIISENGITQPDQILNALHQGVQAALKQGTNVVDTSDGMDVAICTISGDNEELQFAGAYRPLYILNDHKFIKIEADKHPIGGSQLDPDRKFTAHTVKLVKGDSVYMTSDGYADQFGGEKGKKFMVKRFHELLVAMQTKPMQEQCDILEETFTSWKGGFQQVDDILIIGMRF